MARIRTIKPEFWEDEVVGMLSREARLLFIATFNLADDEGLLRWTAPYIKASAFMYDDDISVPDISKIMHELADAGLLFPYIGGMARQQLAMVVNFRKHQKINRPQPGKLPAPSLQNRTVREVYARRDAWVCQLCGGDIPQSPHRNDSYNLSIDHRIPQSQGGSDYPSNVRATHQGCNKSRKDRPDEEFSAPVSMDGVHRSVNDSVNGSSSIDATHGDDCPDNRPGSVTSSDIYSVNGAVSDSLFGSLPEGKGREGNREQGTGNVSVIAEQPSALPLPVPIRTAAPPDAMPRLDVEKACSALADSIEANTGKRPTVTGKWRDSIRLMIDKDGVPLPDVLAAIEWSAGHDFWRSVVLSAPKLREKYQQMSLQAQRGSAPNGRPKPSTTDERVAGWLALGEQFNERQGAQ